MYVARFGMLKLGNLGEMTFCVFEVGGRKLCPVQSSLSINFLDAFYIVNFEHAVIIFCNPK